MDDSRSLHTRISISSCHCTPRGYTDLSQEGRLMDQVCICKSARLGSIKELGIYSVMYPLTQNTSQSTDLPRCEGAEQRAAPAWLHAFGGRIGDRVLVHQKSSHHANALWLAYHPDVLEAPRSVMCQGMNLCSVKLLTPSRMLVQCALFV